ncbi:AsnC-family transcriptional regulatory protein OS=Streptomyces glaucescens OX=1907 GN=SGLAU_14955 PE=4 SV=1 [Streptomyces glaucescens]
MFPFFSRLLVQWGKICGVDDVDRRRDFLAELQQDGRLTVTELAGRVAARVLRRATGGCGSWSGSGAISGYRAVVDPAAVGLTFEALVFVSMRQEDRETVAGFERALSEVPEVVEARARTLR